MANFDAGVAGFEARAFRGLGVFTSTPVSRRRTRFLFLCHKASNLLVAFLQFEVSDDADSMQMLQRSTQVGEFYYMKSPPTSWSDDKGHENYLDILIYDEESDKHVHISFEKACEAAGLVGTGAIPDNERVDVGEQKWPAWCATKTKTQAAIDASKAGTYEADVCMVLCRPFIEHLMMSAVMTVAGRDTGATLFGPADMCGEPI